MIQEIVGTQSTLGQKLRSSQQNGLLGNRSKYSKRPKKLGLEKLSIERLVDRESIKA